MMVSSYGSARPGPVAGVAWGLSLPEDPLSVFCLGRGEESEGWKDQEIFCCKCYRKIDGLVDRWKR